MNETEQNTPEVKNVYRHVRKWLYPAAFFLTGLLLLIFGFWKTLFLIALTALGAWLGSADNVEESAKKAVNKLFPPAQKKVTYSAEDLEKLKQALEKKKAAKAGEGRQEQEEGKA